MSDYRTWFVLSEQECWLCCAPATLICFEDVVYGTEYLFTCDTHKFHAFS